MYKKSITIKEELNKCLPVAQLVNKYFWKTKIGPIFSFIFPLMLMIVYFAISQSKGNDAYIYSGLPSTISLSILPLILLTLPTMNIEFRNSIILRKIKIIGISRFSFILIIYILFTIYSLIFLIFGFFIFCCFISFNKDLLDDINYGSMFYSIFLLIISGISLGLILSVFSKTSLSSQLIGFGVLLLTLIFSGQFMPLSVIGTIKPIKYISLFSPLSYSANILNIAIYSPIEALKESMPKQLQPLLLNGLIEPSNSVFNFNCAFWLFEIDYNTHFNQVANTGELLLKINQVNIYDIWQKVLFVFMPFAFTILFNFIYFKKFKWANR